MPPNHPIFCILCRHSIVRLYIETSNLVYRSHPADKKSSLKLAWSGSRGLRKFRLSKSSVYRCYQRSRRGSASGLRPTTVERVVAECTSWSLLDLSYKLFLHCYAAVAKNSCVSAIAEFLLDTVVRATS